MRKEDHHSHLQYLFCVFFHVFFLVAAPCSLCSSDSWRNLEIFTNPSKHQSCLRLPNQGDYNMW